MQDPIKKRGKKQKIIIKKCKKYQTKIKKKDFLPLDS